MLWKMSEARGRGDTWHDQTTEKKIEKSFNAVRQDLWNKHLQNPALALSEALWRVEVWQEAGSSTAWMEQELGHLWFAR